MTASTTKKKRRGAPVGNTNNRRADATTVLISVRVTEAESAAYKSLAKWRKQDISSMVRELCNAALLQAVTRGGWQPPPQKGAKGD